VAYRVQHSHCAAVQALLGLLGHNGGVPQCGRLRKWLVIVRTLNGHTLSLAGALLRRGSGWWLAPPLRPYGAAPLRLCREPRPPPHVGVAAMGCANSKDDVVEAGGGSGARNVSFHEDARQRQALEAALLSGSFQFAPDRTTNPPSPVGGGGGGEGGGAPAAPPTPAPEGPERATAERLGQSAYSLEDELGTAVAIRAYDSKDTLDLRLSEGDAVVLLEKIDSWYKGYVEDKPDIIGFFPSNFVELSGDAAPARAQPACAADEEESDRQHSKRTLWVGSIPERSADESKIKTLFAKYGVVDSVTVRVKSVEEHGPNKSWAFVSFVDKEGADSCLNASEGVSVPDENGEQVVLRIRASDLQAELSKPSTGMLSKVWDDHKSLLGAAMRAELKQDGDGVKAGYTMGKIEKALSLESTGTKAGLSTSADSQQSYEAPNPGETKFSKLDSVSFKAIKQISKDYEADRQLAKRNSQDYEQTDDGVGP
jgi:hypothetical protein